MPYRPPLAEIAFALKHHADLDQLATWCGNPSADLATTVGLLEEAGRFVAEVFAPLASTGDEHGCVRNPNGTVSTPPGTPEAYQKFVESGWGGISFPEQFGGGGLPWVVTIAFQEMLAAANMGFSLCPLLTQGAIELLLHHASPQQHDLYLPRMIGGQWTASMNLTEPDAGSDVGALRTTAVPQSDGTYRVSGTKIFITYGEHDLAENIVHLVLARTPNATPGTKGISIFIVPKFVPAADGSCGERNGVECLKIEHKIGIHASPTCVLEFNEAVGFLIGDEGAGMRAMFTMMNNARLSVGVEGLATAEAAYQLAAEYAHNRVQGRLAGARDTGHSPIAAHPDVRLMLATMRAHIDAMRALLYFDAAQVDRAASHPNDDERRDAHNLVALLTPLCKSWCSDVGIEMASLGIQIHGGMGYIEETGAARLWRDSRIAPIYEGTNGIQAIDLVTRKLLLEGGSTLDRLLARVAAEAGETTELAAVQRATQWMRTALGEQRIDDALAGATPYLRMLATVVADWVIQRSASAAQAELDAGSDTVTFLENRIASATVFRNRVLPTVLGLERSATTGYSDLCDFEIPQK